LRGVACVLPRRLSQLRRTLVLVVVQAGVAEVGVRFRLVQGVVTTARSRTLVIGQSLLV
jgi:hypothetical protein